MSTNSKREMIKNALFLIIILTGWLSYTASLMAQPNEKVIFDHDGGIDDLLSLMLIRV